MTLDIYNILLCVMCNSNTDSLICSLIFLFLNMVCIAQREATLIREYLVGPLSIGDFLKNSVPFLVSSLHLLLWPCFSFRSMSPTTFPFVLQPLCISGHHWPSKFPTSNHRVWVATQRSADSRVLAWYKLKRVHTHMFFLMHSHAMLPLFDESPADVNHAGLALSSLVFGFIPPFCIVSCYFYILCRPMLSFDIVKADSPIFTSYVSAILRLINKNCNLKLLFKLLIKSLIIFLINMNPGFFFVSPSSVVFLPLCKKCLKLHQY